MSPKETSACGELAHSKFFLEVSIVQRTFEMAHLTALCSTPSRCHHLHTSHQMKMDGEHQRH